MNILNMLIHTIHREDKIYIDRDQVLHRFLFYNRFEIQTWVVRKNLEDLLLTRCTSNTAVYFLFLLIAGESTIFKSSSMTCHSTGIISVTIITRLFSNQTLLRYTCTC